MLQTDQFCAQRVRIEILLQLAQITRIALTCNRQIACFAYFIFLFFDPPRDPNSRDQPLEWKRYSANQPGYLEINNEIAAKNGRILEERRAFWESIGEQLHVDEIEF